jgi:hypothetical protein
MSAVANSRTGVVRFHTASIVTRPSVEEAPTTGEESSDSALVATNIGSKVGNLTAVLPLPDVDKPSMIHDPRLLTGTC